MSVVRAVSRNGEYSFSKPNRDEIVLVAGHGVEGDVHAGVTVRHRSRVRADPSQPNLRQVHLIHGELFDEVGQSGYAVAPGDLGENVTTDGVNLLDLPRGTVLRFGPAPVGVRDGRSGEAAADGAGGAVAGAATNGAGGAVAGVSAAAHCAGGAVAGVGAAAHRAGGAVAGVVTAAQQARLDHATAEAVAALVAAAEREAGSEDPRPAVVVTGLRNPCRQIDAFRDGLLGEVAYRDDRGELVRKAGVMGVVLRGGPVRPGHPVTVELPPPPHRRLDRV